MADCDFLVIGAGSAGYAAARAAAALGLHTVVVEAAEDIGGLCILRGCMPSKTLLASAQRMLAIRRAPKLGVHAGEPQADLPAIIARKRALIGEFAQYRRRQLETGDFEFVRGRAQFVDARAVEVSLRGGGKRRISARAFLLATGSTPAHIPLPGLAECGALHSDDILDAAELPSSVVVLGGGAVAMEMAHYMSAMGSQVRILQRSRHVLSALDEDVAEVVEAGFRARGVEIFTGTRLLRVRRTGASVAVDFAWQERQITLEAEALLDALGRVPALDGLGLERTGVECCRPLVSSTQQTNVPHIFAAGDCTGHQEIVHVAIAEGELAARNAARLLRGQEPLEHRDDRLALFVVFTEPEVAVAGASEKELRERGEPFLRATYPFNDHGKSMVMGEDDGFVKLLAAPGSREILGGAAVGPHASELIHEIITAMAFRATARQLAAIPHYHPTLSEIWTYPAEELAS